MRFRISCHIILLFSLISIGLKGQSGYREKLQSQLDSLVAPYEQSTGTYFGPGMEFNFEKAFIGILKSDGKLYSTDLSSKEYKAGDTLYLTKVDVLGRTTAKAHFGDHKLYYNLKAKQLKEDIVIPDSIEFWRLFDLLKKVNGRKFGPTWNTLACSERDDYSDTVKSEQVWMNSDNSTFRLTLERDGDLVFLDFDLSVVYGNDFVGMGCAETKEQYLEFKFLDGTTLKKSNEDYKYCSLIKFEITKDLEQFRTGIAEITFGFSKKSKTLEIEEVNSQYMIDIKLDCVLD